MPHLKKLVLTGNNLKAFYYNVNDTKDHSNAEVEEAMKNGEAHNHHTDSIITDLADLRLSSNKWVDAFNEKLGIIEWSISWKERNNKE